MSWFDQHNIEAGDPLLIQENYLKEGKAKVMALLQTVNKANSPKSQMPSRAQRKLLTISTNLR